MCPTNRNSASALWTDYPSRFEQAFAILDRDGDGTIKSSDLSSFFTSCLGQSCTQDELEAMIAMADLDGNGAVDLQEFQCLMTEGITASSAMKERPETKALREMFQVLDMNKDGLLSAEDLKTAMDLSGEPVSDNELNGMIAAAGGSPMAPIDFESFSTMMTGLYENSLFIMRH